MLLSILCTSVFVASALAVAGPQPYLAGPLGARDILPDYSFNSALGLKRQYSGYGPTHGPSCTGGGDTCQSACGSTYLQCASDDDDIHCYDTAINQSCCADGNGYACDDGYYCSETASKRTWCCPNAMNLAQCAALFSLTETLQSETASATVSPTSEPTSTAISTTSTGNSFSVSSKSAPTSTPVTPVATTTSTLPTSTRFANSTSTSAPILFTAAAAAPNAAVGAAVPAMALAAGAFFL